MQDEPSDTSNYWTQPGGEADVDAEQEPANAFLSFIYACQKALLHTSSVPLDTPWVLQSS